MAGAWAALGYGLLFSTSDQQAWGELEAGGRFAANFVVYLPYYGLTPLIAVVVFLGLLRRPDVLSPLAATAVAIGLFACWVTVQDYLFAAQPQLFASVVWCFLADAGAAVALTWAWVTTQLSRPLADAR